MNGGARGIAYSGILDLNVGNSLSFNHVSGRGNEGDDLAVGTKNGFSRRAIDWKRSVLGPPCKMELAVFPQNHVGVLVGVGLAHNQVVGVSGEDNALAIPADGSVYTGGVTIGYRGNDPGSRSRRRSVAFRPEEDLLARSCSLTGDQVGRVGLEGHLGPVVADGGIEASSIALLTRLSKAQPGQPAVEDLVPEDVDVAVCVAWNKVGGM